MLSSVTSVAPLPAVMQMYVRTCSEQVSLL